MYMPLVQWRTQGGGGFGAEAAQKICFKFNYIL